MFLWLPTEFGKNVCFQTQPVVFDFYGCFEPKCGDSSGSVTFAIIKVEIEKSDVYIYKCQRECVIQCQILSSWVVMQSHPLAVETRLSFSTSSSPCSESVGTRLWTRALMALR